MEKTSPHENHSEKQVTTNRLPQSFKLKSSGQNPCFKDLLGWTIYQIYDNIW